MQRVPERHRTRPGDADVENGLRLADVVGGRLIVAPHRTRPRDEAPVACGLDAHCPDRHSVLLAVIVHDEQLSNGDPNQPVRYRPRADPVVRHEPDERAPVQSDEGGDRRNL
jgi:hypothetical protein